MARNQIPEPPHDPAVPTVRQVIDIGLGMERRHVGSYGDTGYFRASSIGYCMRRQVFDRAGLKHTRPEDPFGLRTLSLGNIYHDWLKRRLDLAGLSIVDEFTFIDDELGISGHADAVWGGTVQPLDDERTTSWSPRFYEYVTAYRAKLEEQWPLGVPVVASEFKSSAGYAVQKMYEEGPSFQHKHQVGTYWFLRDQILAKNEHPAKHVLEQIEHWEIVVVSKDNMQFIEFRLRPDQMAQTEKRLELLRFYWDEEKLPPCECGQNISWEPRYCGYRDPATSDNAPLCCDPQLFDQIDWDAVKGRTKVDA